MFHIIPVVDTLSRYVDQRVRVANVSAESTLTRDTVPVNVDAIVFWLVWNAEKSILEVEDFVEAIVLSAQTALRESIGRHELAQMITERETLGHELQRILDEKTNPWGITVQSVEIRDVRIPQALEDAMSRQAQAERERQARIILGQAETEISDKFAQAALVYSGQPGGAASARDEHAVRGDQGEGLDGDRAVVGGGDDGAGRLAGDGGSGKARGTRCEERSSAMRAKCVVVTAMAMMITMAGFSQARVNAIVLNAEYCRCEGRRQPLKNLVGVWHGEYRGLPWVTVTLTQDGGAFVRGYPLLSASQNAWNRGNSGRRHTGTSARPKVRWQNGDVPSKRSPCRSAQNSR